MAKWPIVRFEELAADEKSSFSKPYGSAYTKDDYVSDGVPLVRGVNLGNGIYHDDDYVFITEEKADKLPGANLAPGDLVITHRGTIGQASMIPRSPRYPRYVLSTSQVKARLDSSRAVPEFYCYWLLSPAGQHEILSHVSTVGVPGLVQPVASVKGFKVPHPSLREQKAIAEVLGALDDKIAVNKSIATTAQRLMQARYMRAIDEVSTPKPLGGMVDFHNRKRVPLSSRQRAEIPGPYPYYGAAGVVGYVRDFIFSGSHLLVGEDGSVITDERKPVTQYVWGDFWVNNHAHVLTGKGISTELLAVALQFTDVAALVTGAVQPKLNMRNLMRLEVPVPAGEQIAALDGEISEVTALVRRRSDESRTLAALRDTLLPQLMSGKLRVRDAEKIVEDAV
ncbi:restriction endonuclease subunit S [Streptomyces sp. MBT33]|uniref:restriction endonuclease subunit S n=1 Tax=Streptomyces sp. MBT33 TaxID=1488363 RepID=UPI00190CBC1B|nr:restriction endonuclease subunit S [Streptomyces sp. MBT33]MBK3645122.1 restriction endonuclease subunit S [Streptomyces sp. MBT33]